MNDCFNPGGPAVPSNPFINDQPVCNGEKCVYYRIAMQNQKIKELEDFVHGIIKREDIGMLEKIKIGLAHTSLLESIANGEISPT